MSITCNSSPNTTAICSPKSNETWYVGNSYNITWDPTHVSYNNTDVVDIEINYQTKANSTETYLLGFSNILKNTSNISINVTNNWLPPNIPFDLLMYDIYLLPHGTKSSKINNTTSFSSVTFNIMTPTATLPTQTPDSIIDNNNNSNQTHGLSTVGIVIIAVVSILLILLFMFKEKLFKNRIGHGIPNSLCMLC